MQTGNLSKILRRRIFRLKILHRQFHLILTVLVGKKHKKWVKMEKFTPLAKILHCRRQWQISPLESIWTIISLDKIRVLSGTNCWMSLSPVEGEGEEATAWALMHLTSAEGDEGLVCDRFLASFALLSPEAILAGCCWQLQSAQIVIVIRISCHLNKLVSFLQ